ncbi:MULTISPECIES: class II glutamine amidotransferase [Methylobacterium]|jgi:predicted glutamine amidotransferase|uniref:Glutamine amidotransferase n=3 Tax=Methylobacterium TaxID=407 RepID=A0AAE8HXH7_9HYPH|nr:MULTISPECIES: class II glutamine amidotransferase [Methylobacterium]KOX57702.1 glutamine amidotransferase [Streptomyces purpurogeneiscleroticus]AIQ89007.1 Glutamine amidotransferase class-II [Methylobacterium oryzae CBMB20]APT29919.1 putative glutamine amidotransferase [Methylobacterium phyllosphaerae]AWV18448.1 class II glutamine amidotransferase [Methylobacterium sp. XJLW]MBA9065525.1 glutamine amidotransferase [Methylobacterium fujisawaense]
MCELLGMSANVPTDIRFSFAGLARRGGETGPHADGWGISFYDGRTCRSFHEPEPSARSQLARLLRDMPIKSRIVVAHVRKANRGRVSLENTHPFSRELWGRRWTFAHNGQLKGVKRLPLGGFMPIGSTDSEHAFCWMLGRLQARFRALPRPETLDRAVADLAGELHALGVFNMLLTDSRTLYAHCGKRLCYLTRRAPFGKATLIDEDWQVDFAEETTEHDVVTVIATQALTRDECWTDLARGDVLTLRDGAIRLLRPANLA